MMTPVSGCPRDTNITGIVAVAPRVKATKIRLATNFPTVNSHAFMGKVSSISHVFSLRSCAQERMVMAGIKMHSIKGRLAKYSRMSAVGKEKKGVMNKPTLMVTNTIIKM